MKNTIATLMLVFSGGMMLVMSAGSGIQPVNGSEARQVSGGALAIAECDNGVFEGSKTQCTGTCANNPIAISCNANSMTTSSSSCGNCGNMFNEVVNCNTVTSY